MLACAGRVRTCDGNDANMPIRADDDVTKLALQVGHLQSKCEDFARDMVALKMDLQQKFEEQAEALTSFHVKLEHLSEQMTTSQSTFPRTPMTVLASQKEPVSNVPAVSAEMETLSLNIDKTNEDLSRLSDSVSDVRKKIEELEKSLDDGISKEAPLRITSGELSLGDATNSAKDAQVIASIDIVEKRLTGLALAHRSELELRLQEKINHALEEKAADKEKSSLPKSPEVSMTASEFENTKVADDGYAEEATNKFSINVTKSGSLLGLDYDWRYEFDASVWDASVLIGFHIEGVLDLVVHVTMTMAYFVVMFCMVYIISHGAGFGDNPYADEILQRLKFWRATVGHSAGYTNLYDSSSLVARVCSDDVALTIGVGQQTVAQDVLAYTAPVFGSLAVGPLVCCCCLVMYSVIIILDIQQALFQLLGIWSLRQKQDTHVHWIDQDTAKLTHVSYERCMLAVLMFILRVWFNIILLFYGCLWVTFTPDVQDLLLNTTALAFLLDIDELFFKLVAPATLRVTIGALQPVTMPRFFGRQYFPILFLLLTICVVLFNSVFMLQPLLDQMEEAEKILCGNHVNFVATISSTLGIHWAPSHPFNPDAPMSDWADARYYGMESLIKTLDSAGEYTFAASSVNEVLETRAANLAAYVKSLAGSTCEDELGKHIGNLLYVLTNNASMKSHVSCQSFKWYCPYEDPGAGMMRILCPATCGCLQPDSPLVHLTSANGGCRQLEDCRVHRDPSAAVAVAMLSGRLCEDADLEILQNLSRWNQTLEHVNSSNFPEGLSTRLAQYGCRGLLTLPNATRTSVCAGETLAFLCPATCDCKHQCSLQSSNGACSRDCPYSCTRSNYLLECRTSYDATTVKMSQPPCSDMMNFFLNDA